MPVDAGIDRMVLRSAILSFAVGLGMLLLKFSAYALTNSAAIFSDALESVIHVAATGFLVFCVGYSQLPPDEDHPFGHGRIDNFSVGFEGGLILLAGLGIIWEATAKWLRGDEIQDMGLGFALVALAAVVNLLLALHLFKVGRAARSEMINADAAHVLSDVWTSLAIIAGVGVIWLFNWPFLDILIAYAVALNLVWSGFRLAQKAVKALMDKADPQVLETIVAAINEIRQPDWLDVHNLRVHSVGNHKHIDFHIVIPPEWTVERAHADIDHLEEHILAKLHCHGSVMVHLDPYLDVEAMQRLAAGANPGGRTFTVEDATRFVPKRSQHHGGISHGEGA